MSNDEQKHALFDEISVRFMRAVKQVYGNEAAVDTLNHLQTTLGKEWTGRVIFHMMSDNHKYMEQVTLRLNAYHAGPFQKINAIKAIRSLTGMGLSESKHFVEMVIDGSPMTARLRADRGDDLAQFERYVRADVEELATAGFVAEIM